MQLSVQKCCTTVAASNGCDAILVRGRALIKFLGRNKPLSSSQPDATVKAFCAITARAHPVGSGKVACSVQHFAMQSMWIAMLMSMARTSKNRVAGDETTGALFINAERSTPVACIAL